MNIGIRLHDTLPGTLRERLGYAAEQGFGCVQLAMGKAVPGFRMDLAPALLTEALAGEVKAEFQRAGIECAVLGCYLKLAQEDEEEARRVREIYLAHLRFAAMIGARCVGTETPPASGPEGEACRSEAHFKLFIDRALPVVRAAEEFGVTLAIEPVCSHIVHDAARAERMLEELNSERAGIILDAVNLIDSAHAGQADAVVRDAVARLGEKACVLHMKDYVPQPGAPRPRPVACGLGSLRYGPLLKLAREKELPMTLENTTPDNAADTRRFLETYRE